MKNATQAQEYLQVVPDLSPSLPRRLFCKAQDLAKLRTLNAHDGEVQERVAHTFDESSTQASAKRRWSSPNFTLDLLWSLANTHQHAPGKISMYTIRAHLHN